MEPLNPNVPQPIRFAAKYKAVAEGEFSLDVELYVYEPEVKKYLGHLHGGEITHLPISTETPVLVLMPYIRVNSLDLDKKRVLRSALGLENKTVK